MHLEPSDQVCEHISAGHVIQVTMPYVACTSDKVKTEPGFYHFISVSSTSKTRKQAKEIQNDVVYGLNCAVGL